MEASSRATRIGVGLVMVTVVILGSTPSLVVFAGSQVQPLTLVATRGLVACLVLGALLRLGVGQDSLPAAERRRTAMWAFLMGLVVFGPITVTYYLAFRFIATGMAVAIAYVYPTLVILGMAAYRRVPPSRTAVLLAMGAMVGVACLSLPGSGSNASLVGIALTLITAVGFALYVTVSSFLSVGMSPLRQTAWVTAGTIPSTVLAAWVVDGGQVPQGALPWSVIAGQALLFVLAMVCYYAGLRRLGPSYASLIDTGQPLVAAVSGALLLGERMIPLQVVGLLLIVASVAGSARMASRDAGKVDVISGAQPAR